MHHFTELTFDSALTYVFSIGYKRADPNPIYKYFQVEDLVADSYEARVEGDPHIEVDKFLPVSASGLVAAGANAVLLFPLLSAVVIFFRVFISTRQ